MKTSFIIVDVTFRSASGRSLLQERDGIKRQNLSDFAASKETREQAIMALRKLGFELVGSASDFGVSIAGPVELIRTVFGEGELSIPEQLSQWLEAARIPPPGKFYPDRDR